VREVGRAGGREGRTEGARGGKEGGSKIGKESNGRGREERSSYSPYILWITCQNLRKLINQRHT